MSSFASSVRNSDQSSGTRISKGHSTRSHVCARALLPSEKHRTGSHPSWRLAPQSISSWKPAIKTQHRHHLIMSREKSDSLRPRTRQSSPTSNQTPMKSKYKTSHDLKMSPCNVTHTTYLQLPAVLLDEKSDSRSKHRQQGTHGGPLGFSARDTETNKGTNFVSHVQQPSRLYCSANDCLRERSATFR